MSSPAKARAKREKEAIQRGRNRMRRLEAWYNRLPRIEQRRYEARLRRNAEWLQRKEDLGL